MWDFWFIYSTTIPVNAGLFCHVVLELCEKVRSYFFHAMTEEPLREAGGSFLFHNSMKKL